jgi:hypothetical protein
MSSSRRTSSIALRSADGARIGAPDGELEVEADRAAEEYMREHGRARRQEALQQHPEPQGTELAMEQEALLKASGAKDEGLSQAEQAAELDVVSRSDPQISNEHERTDPFRSVVPIDPDHPFRAIPISLWRIVSGTVG